MKIGDIFKIIAWDIINPFLLKIKKEKIYNVDGFAGINLGCGIECPKNWIGIDGGITHYFVKKKPKRSCRNFV